MDGLQSWCKRCFADDALARARAAGRRTLGEYRHDKSRAIDAQRSIGCGWCHKSKPATREFFPVVRGSSLAWICLCCKPKYRTEHPEDPERTIVSKRNYRARLHAAAGFHTCEDVAAQRKRQRGHCYWCRVKVGRHYHVDHVTPLSKGGSNGPENIVITCAHCNHAKNARHPMDWSLTLC